ncbi:bifunctional hydroxymethylpyrimidine kinase/phosphomethylpyrimidine kinase [Nocardioides sp. TRM66260-LWL]|uniref:bifunctional hydroxymethylpyrimidine kinase/phosphomethylpyrimidine kinase n=1 Tax=Nocardioides sp. TRM66260-LWL TaxID=2874478 RepID=UPI001CC41A4A|nr:bifunctional hydroxymethylpyrimidine kinase/phosphomethylpyrimidine kinase [Nocardioides sp. TRM66260-LWL]MBZ5733113.1 bifunctional hydroxymethylpyrimidine kinase/phosphomethylpyrimidine kinase [Nocardioides sp. TRM66260-LWL]
MSEREPVMLTIAGSDPSGGAGLQADVKTATALGCYAATVVTGLTVQDTTGVHAVHPVEPAVVRAQLEAVAADLDVRAVKTGMLGDVALVAAVADGLAELLPDVPLVLDPVMVATSGHRLVPDEAVAAIRELLVPRAQVVTPNAPEAVVLTGEDDREAAGAALVALGARWALVKGGHVPVDGVVTDLLVGAGATRTLTAPWRDTPHTHGTGCTLASGIAARLALGDDVPAAVTAAHAFLQAALVSGAGRTVGRGHGPVDHLWRLREA